MTDHKNKDRAAKVQRGASRRAQLRQQERRIKQLQDLALLQTFQFSKLLDENKNLYRRLCETQALLPFWIRKVP